jgi:iron complex transport system substrate-binding protein
MWETIEAAADSVRGLPRRCVFFAEWIEPPFCAGHWLPEMIELAGGADILGHAGRPSYATTWDTVLAHEPELVVIAPCGFDADTAAERAAELRLPCPSVAVDATATTPGRRAVADGVRQLAHLFHPGGAGSAYRQSRWRGDGHDRRRPRFVLDQSAGNDSPGLSSSVEARDFVDRDRG